MTATAAQGDSGRRSKAATVVRVVATSLVVAALLIAAGWTFYTLRTDRYRKAYGGCAAAPSADAAGMTPVAAPSAPAATGLAADQTAATATVGSGLPVATLKQDQTTTVAFGRSTRPKSLVVYLALSKPLPADSRQLVVRVDPFRRSDDARLNGRAHGIDAQPDDNAIQAAASPDGRELRLEVCFGRQGNRLGNPGTYNGTVTLTDFRLASEVPIPITVTMQYIHGTVLFWLVFAAVVPGTWLLWVTKREINDSNRGAFNKEWLSWILSVGGIVATVTGTVAAFSVYAATYLKDPTWGSSALQLISLYGAMFSAFVATSGIAHAGAQRFQTPAQDSSTANIEGEPLGIDLARSPSGGPR